MSKLSGISTAGKFLALVAFFLELLTFSCLAQGLSWRSLVFEAERAFSHVTSTVEIVPDHQSAKRLFPSFQPALSDCINITPDYEGFPCIHIITAVEGLFIPDMQYERAVWFDPDTMQAVFRLRWNGSRPEIIKFYTWGNSGVTRLKLKYDRVSRSIHEVKKTFYNRDRSADMCSVLSEPAVLLYFVSHAHFNKSENSSICVFGKKEFHLLSIKKKKIHLSTDSPVNSCKIFIAQHDDLKTGRAEFTRCPRADTLFLISEIDHHQRDAGREKFSLMGLQGEIRIEVNMKEGLPVRISGVNEHAGSVVLELKKAVIPQRAGQK